MITHVEHRVLPTGLHCLIDDKGRVEVYTEKEYEHLSWWDHQRIKYFGHG